MRKITLLAIALCCCNFLLAQTAPLNDDCSGAIDLGTAPTACPGAVYSNVDATASLTGDDNPSCFNGNISERDVWFKFTCPTTLLDFRITLMGTGANSIVNPEFAVYRGDCAFGELAEYHCAIAALGETELIYDMEGLTPGFTYYIRVTDYSATAAPNSGDFTLCVGEIPPDYNVDDGSTGLCTGTLYDTGGPDGDYAFDENETFTICPSSNPSCILFTLEYYNIEEQSFQGGDVLSFYDGNSTSAPLIASINGGSDNLGGTVSNSGGVAFTVQATSGCLTVNFVSDQSLEFEGWKGSWTCSGTACPQVEDITLDETATADDLIDAVKSPSTVISNGTLNCGDGASGIFSYPTDNNELGLKKGILLTTGSALIAQGPNTFGSAGQLLEPFSLDDLGDDDLNYLSEQQGGKPSFDACVLEMDVFVGTNELAFEYVFGSEEYPEFVHSDYNDIFAFLVSGPGITGDPNIGNQENIAILPGTTTPVQINSVNQVDNWQYYRNNFYGQSLQYDGLTSDSLGAKKSLTARVPVIPCNTYHLKLAVADRGDESWDSGVFISDIKAGAPDVTSQFTGGIKYLIEQCSNNDNLLLIKLNKPSAVVTSYVVTLGGSATNGLDYTTNIPAVITFQPGETQALFNIVVLTDNLPEGTELMKIFLSNDFGCGSVVLKEYDVEIKDSPEIIVTLGDSVKVCAGSNIQLIATGADSYVWTPAAPLNNAYVFNPTVVLPTQTQWFKVTGNIGICTGTDSVLVRVVGPTVQIAQAVDTEICVGESSALMASTNLPNTPVSWSPSTGLSNPGILNPVATPTQTTTYTITATLENCAVSANVTIKVDTLFSPVFHKDTTICQHYPIVLASNLNASTSEYLWSPATGLDDPTLSNATATPDQTTTYTLTTTSDHGYCSSTKTVKIAITPANVIILGDEKREICLGDTLTLNALSNPVGTPISWTPTFAVGNPSGNLTQTSPDESVTIYATYTVGICTVRDSIRIRVDSLPNQLITRIQDKTVYCEGDTIYLISPTYEPADFKDIDTRWLFGPGQITPDSNWNLVLIASDTFLYKRAISNHACVDTAEVLIPVSKPPIFTLTALPNPVCAGDTVQINLSVDPANTKYEWKPDPTLSCLDCPNPISTALSTTEYIVTAKEAPCPSAGNIKVFVEAPPALNLPTNTQLCLGDTLKLNDVVEPGATYTWSSVPAGYSSQNPTPTVYPVAGNTQYRVTVKGDKCTIERFVDVNVRTATISAGADQEFCLGETITLNATTSGAAGTINWAPVNQQGATVTDQPTQTTSYLATLVFGSGPNCEVSDLVTATRLASVSLSDIQYTPDGKDSLCSGEKLILQVNANPANVPVTYVWTENNNILSGLTGDSIQVTTSISEGTVQYNVVATSLDGCTATSNPVEFKVKRCILIPNVFTPDGDGTNDVFTLYIPSGTAIVKSLSVYNRWGQRVFESNASQNAWNGKINDKEAPMDVYVWHAVVLYPDGKEEKFKGDVTLLR